MSDNLIGAKFISGLITGYYYKLADLIIMEDSDEFKFYIDKIIESIIIEDEEYKKIDFKTIKDYFATMDITNTSKLPADDRCFKKLNQREKILLGEPRLDDDTLLSSVIDSKIIIDTLKIVHSRILYLKEDDTLDDDTYTNLINYYKVSMFTYLTDNSFIEKLALKYSFDIDEMPSIDFEMVRQKFHINFIDNSMLTFYFKIFMELDALCCIEADEPILRTYLTLVELSRIEVLLKLLDKKTFDNFIQVFDYNYGDETSDPILNAKKLIKQIKEEFKNK